jgi:choline dehydrogenase-like flavoprotein
MGSSKSELTADLCVIGSGIAGMLVAERALDGGRTVLMLERGTEMTHAERLKQRSHADPLPFNKRPHRNKQGTWEYVFRPTYNLGGSTNAFYGNMPRIHPSHFELGPFGGASRRWPITYAELEPYYLQAERRLRICGNSEHPMFNGRFDYPLPPHRLSPSDRACVQIFGADSVTQVPTVRPSRPVEGRPKCCSSNRCALCPVDSKGTALNTISPASR